MITTDSNHSAYVRRPVVAGMFYPATPHVLQKMVAKFLAAGDRSADLPLPKAIVAPHAGYDYSGAIAGSAYACLQNAQHQIKTVVILAPAHRYPFSGIALTLASTYLTPLGAVKIDVAAVAKLRAAQLPAVQVLEGAYDEEHALEVQLPFLQVALGKEFSIVPLLVGDATTEEVALVLEKVWDGDETLIVISSDLSHYESYDDAYHIDAATAKIILALDYASLEQDMACGAVPIRGLLKVARCKNLRAVQIDLRSSGDTAGDKGRVVGYGAFHFVNAGASANYSAVEKAFLLKVAYAAIKYGVEHGKMLPALNLKDYSAKLRERGASFVTLEIDGELRGCIGSLAAHQPLIADVAHNAFAAAFHDPRFYPVTHDELSHLTLHISVLSVPQTLYFSSEEDLLAQLRPHVDGLILSDKGQRGTFLPAVWEQLPDPRLFLQQLKIKAGLPPNYWSNSIKVERYTAEIV